MLFPVLLPTLIKCRSEAKKQARGIFLNLFIIFKSMMAGGRAGLQIIGSNSFFGRCNIFTSPAAIPHHSTKCSTWRLYLHGSLLLLLCLEALLVFLKRAPPRGNSAILTKPQLVHCSFNQVLVVRHLKGTSVIVGRSWQQQRASKEG